MTEWVSNRIAWMLRGRAPHTTGYWTSAVKDIPLGGVTRFTWRSCCRGIGRRLRSRFLVDLLWKQCFLKFHFIRLLLWSSCQSIGSKMEVSCQVVEEWGRCIWLETLLWLSGDFRFHSARGSLSYSKKNPTKKIGIESFRGCLNFAQTRQALLQELGLP